MADVGKKKITVDTKINMFGEYKGTKAPAWFASRAKLEALDAELPVKRSLMLDPRKWKKKDLEDGAYAVAKYELAFFATMLTTHDKAIAKAAPKGKRSFKKNDKTETDDEKAALDNAETELVKIHKKFVKAISNKVSLALDEVEADKGDNKAALAAGKDALKRFDGLDTDTMFKAPTKSVLQTLVKLSNDLNDAGDGNSAAFKEAARSLSVCKKEFQSTAKEAQNVTKYLLYKGNKMSKDKNAAPELQEVGKLISNGAVNTNMNKLVSSISAFERELDDIIKFVDAGSASSAAVASKSRSFADSNKGKDKALKEAVGSVRIVSKKFNEAAKAVK